MPADQAQLLLSIDASVEILKSEIAKGTSIVSKFAETTERDAGRAAEAFTKLGEKAAETAKEFVLLGAEILIASSIKEAIEKAIEFSEALVKQSEQLGVTTKFLQEFRFAATQSATSADAADKALGKFSVTLGKAAEGNKAAAEAFSKLGVNIADSSGNLRPTEAIFRDVADAVSKIEGPAQQASAVVALFGRGGQALLPILKEGAKGFDEFAEALRKAGLELTPEQIDRLENLSNAARKVKQEISTELAKVIGDNADAILKLGNAAHTATGYLDGFLQRARGALTVIKTEGLGSELLNYNRADLQKIGTPAGQVDYFRGQVAAQQRVVADHATPGLINSTDFGRVRLADDRKELADRQAKLDQSAKDLKAYLNPPKPVSDLGATGGPVTPVKDDSAAKDAAAADRERQRLADQAEARLVTLKREADTLAGNIGKQLAQLAATPEEKLSADIAGAQAETTSKISKVLLDSTNDTTPALHAARATVIADLKKEGDIAVQVIQDSYDRQHAAALASITSGNEQILLQNRAANADLVKDDDERAALQKQIASDEVDFQIAEIDRQIKAEKKTLKQDEIDALRTRQAELAAGKPAKLEAIDRGNQGPVQDFLDSIPDTAGKMNKALQDVEANGLKTLTDDITAAIDGTKNLGDAFADVSKSIIADLIKIAVEKEIVGPLGSFLFGGKSASDSGGIFSALGSLFGGGAGPEVAAPEGFLKFADGGDPPVGVPSIVGERGKELFVPKVPGRIYPAGTFGGMDGVTINQTIAPNFAGNAATREEVVAMGQIAKQQAIAGVKDAMGRRGSWR